LFVACQHVVNTALILKEAPMNQAIERDDPAVWFLLLERGRKTGDFALAARAKRELERLGVFVRYRRPKRGNSSHEHTGGD
jgi:hypothetical protein